LDRTIGFQCDQEIKAGETQMIPTNRTWFSATFFFTTLAAALPCAAQSRNPRSTYICTTDESVANINRQFSLQGGQALNGKCMNDLPNVNKRCNESDDKGYWCDVLDVYCKVIGQRDAEEDKAAADRKREADARHQQYLQQLQAPAPMGDDLSGYFMQQNDVTNQALQNIFNQAFDSIPSITDPPGPEPTCRARQAAKRRLQAIPSKTAPAQSLPTPTKDDLKKKPAKHSQTPSSGTSYQDPVYYGSPDSMYTMPPPNNFGSPSPRPRTALQDHLCHSCNEQREFACNKKNEPNMLGSVASYWAQLCAKNCYNECGY
jgi:hypothetical protein